MPRGKFIIMEKTFLSHCCWCKKSMNLFQLGSHFHHHSNCISGCKQLAYLLLVSLFNKSVVSSVKYHKRCPSLLLMPPAVNQLNTNYRIVDLKEFELHKMKKRLFYWTLYYCCSNCIGDEQTRLTKIVNKPFIT